MLRLKANKTALYKLVADYVDNLPPMRSGTEFIKYSRTPDYYKGGHGQGHGGERGGRPEADRPH